jgi:hypothetical protein
MGAILVLDVKLASQSAFTLPGPLVHDVMIVTLSSLENRPKAMRSLFHHL